MRLLANNEVQEEAKAAFLQADGDQPCQFIKIAGPTRSGKSTFANALLGTTAFQTSDSAEPCTQGIDFCGLRPLAPLARRLGIEGSASGLLSILDIEGGGDRSLQYDVQNLMSAFMLPGVVIWNVLGHPRGPRCWTSSLSSAASAASSWIGWRGRDVPQRPHCSHSGLQPHVFRGPDPAPVTGGRTRDKQ
eukprot:TRINITY_DN12270_c0_g1_i1.p1 TRINITY_DN12270_c0_g1~~TRINITY_DN12270_c0_g1_i1.p1  ORF type:complete len:190 (+),score=34.72 TRINITY_DN12270_c0_g1_i1:29-598(+)